MTPVLIASSFVLAIFGLLAWLHYTAEPEQPEPVTPPDDDDVEGVPI